MNRPDDPGDHGLGYDFEVKEQDRWLPIANGKSHLASVAFPEWLTYPRVPCPCAMLRPNRTRPSLTAARQWML